MKNKKKWKNSLEILENFGDKERVILGFYLWSSNGQTCGGINRNLSNLVYGYKPKSVISVPKTIL